MKALQNKFNFPLPLILFVSAILFCGSAKAQDSGVIESFAASKRDGSVHLVWYISAGRSCNGTIVYHSTDARIFTRIGSIEGICGNAITAQYFDFTDYKPAPNQINYYRLEPGGYGYSEIVSVDCYGLNPEGYLLTPNPVSGVAKIRFDNDRNLDKAISIFNQAGSLVKEITTNENSTEFDTSVLPAGLYYFGIRDISETNIIKGKMVVVH